MLAESENQQKAESHLHPQAYSYYNGIGCEPIVFVASTGLKEQEPASESGTGDAFAPERPMKALFPVGRHKIDDFWEDSLADEVPKRLNALNIKWKSVDIVRIATRDESGRCDPQKAPVVLWVGVAPGSTSCEKGRKAAFNVRDLLLEKGLDDVDVELREVVMWPDFRNEV